MNIPADRARGLVGESPQICHIRNHIPKLARSSAPILLLGESGTGKEVIARAIYEANPAGRFVPVDCGALVGPLMESELFGHAKGAFTGADSRKVGLIEAADGGTVFFDEIGDLPLDMQVKLLRLLQEREYRPVGSLEWKKVQMRVIAATHRDLERRVAEGQFRQDLYYRLNVGRVHLPALRERKQDIPLLVDRFLDQMGASHRFTQKALDVMLDYDWPGNVRQLRNVIERVLMLNSGPWVDVESLSTELQTHRRALEAVPIPFPAGDSDDADAPVCQMPPRRAPIVPLPEAERRAIMEAVGLTKGDRGKAARMLGISRTTLYRKLKEYQVQFENCA